MSVLGKRWLIKSQNNDKTIFERIMENRGFNSLDEISDFHDPFLFEDMEKAVQRIKNAIDSNQSILIFGDYDVDGISGAAILIHILRKLKANVTCCLPNRLTDGYGISIKFIDEFIQKNINLIITVDCGISCYQQIKKAKDHNIDTIITDHHTIPEILPEAVAILHPKKPNTTYPFRELTGAGVALKLAQALIKKYLPSPEQDECFNSLLDLATLGTIADLGSLKDENRLIVIKGLTSLANTKWLGLKKIKELANMKEGDAVDATHIGFQLAPRINAAGRIGDPYTALTLLLQEEQNENIKILGDKLEQLNRERQNMTEQALKEVEEKFSQNEKQPYIYIAHNPNWHVGVLGLIAGKLVEKHGRPAIIMQDFGDTLVASARSPEYFNIIEVLTAHKDHLMNFGGHAQAAGFNIKKTELREFIEKISTYTEEKLKNVELKSTLEIDCELSFEEINFDLIAEIEKLQPFGVDNKKPTFIINSLEPQFIDKVGHDGNHLKFTARFNNKNFPVIAFRMGCFADQLRKHRKIDLVFQLDRHRWKDRDFIQFHALDFRVIGQATESRNENH